MSSYAPDAPIFVETQTWFCHLASNEGSSRLVANARCGSHIDVGYNADSPAHVTAAIADMRSRGVTGMVMDWSGKETGHDADATFYPTHSGTNTATTRGSTEVSTNTIYEYAAQIGALPTGTFSFAVQESEGVTNCHNDWAGGCSCWPAYGTACNATTQVISDLSYIQKHWEQLPGYLHVDGKPVVVFFASDHNACHDKKTDKHCQFIDWDAVRTFVPEQAWIFESTTGYGHDDSNGAFGWVHTSAYPGTSDSSAGLSGVKSYDNFAKANATVKQQIYTAAYKGFDDAVTDGWQYADGSSTRYIEQRCGQTWLDSLAQIKTDFTSGLAMLELVTWDDYEEATEMETGIGTCITALDGKVTGHELSWTTSYSKDLTNGATGTDTTIDHFELWATGDGVHVTRIGPNLLRDSSGHLPYSFDLSTVKLPADATALHVQAVGMPFLENSLSSAIALP